MNITNKNQVSIYIRPNAPYMDGKLDDVKPCKCGCKELNAGGEPNFEWWQDIIECRSCRRKIGSGTEGLRFLVEKWNEND